MKKQGVSEPEARKLLEAAALKSGRNFGYSGAEKLLDFSDTYLLGSSTPGSTARPRRKPKPSGSRLRHHDEIGYGEPTGRSSRRKANPWLTGWLTVYTAELRRHTMVRMKPSSHPWENDLTEALFALRFREEERRFKRRRSHKGRPPERIGRSRDVCRQSSGKSNRRMIWGSHFGASPLTPRQTIWMFENGAIASTRWWRDARPFAGQLGSASLQAARRTRSACSAYPGLIEDAQQVRAHGTDANAEPIRGLRWRQALCDEIEHARLTSAETEKLCGQHPCFGDIWRGRAHEDGGHGTVHQTRAQHTAAQGQHMQRARRAVAREQRNGEATPTDRRLVLGRLRDRCGKCLRRRRNRSREAPTIEQ